MEDALLELVIAPTRGAVPIRYPIARRLTTLGGAEDADVRLPGVPEHWAVVRREAGALVVRVVGGGEHRLAPGAPVRLDGVELSVAVAEAAAGTDAAVERLASALASAEGPDDALQRILAGLIDAAAADSGAVIVTRDEGYTVAAARDAGGTPLPGAAELLSDTIVKDVLGSGERLYLDDVRAHGRYAQVPSVTSLALRSVVCLPMRLDGRTLGAVFLGRKDRRRPFSDRLAGELRLLAAMAVPFLAQLRRGLPASADELVGESDALDGVRRLIARLGPSDLGVLVRGPSGSGKELVARAIHAASRRAARPLVAINCAAVPESLLAGELFGYKKGAFTGAATDRRGLVESAHGSTLLLDEVGDMPLAMQASLLRVLEQREVVRLGESAPRPVDFRLVAATHRDLDSEVAAGRFREDLLFRLREVTVEVPPLSARGDDVVLLARCFLRQAEHAFGLGYHSLPPETIEALRRHAWPGNVRELRAAMRRAAILADAGAIAPADLQLGGASPAGGGIADLGDTTRPLADARDDFVQRYVAAAVERAGGNREAAARALGIGVRTLYRYL